MKVLIIDHFFGQDTDAFVHTGGHEYWSVSNQPFYEVCRDIFHEEVFTGLEAYFRPQYAAERARYTIIARRMLHELYMRFPFDVILAPSDSFFWIRSIIDAAKEMEIPFVVLQKEATIPPGWLNGPAQEWGAISPFIADHMLVSSQHHKQFWVNSGVPPEIIEVTGQPRFDLYRQPQRWKTWQSMGVQLDERRRNILFFTFDQSAYLPFIVRDGMTPWAQLRREIEDTLVALARDDGFNLLIKSHPVPGEDQTENLQRLGRNPNVHVLDPQGDTRQYLVNADVVVGFQTTAMFESLAARKPTLYPFWTAPVHEYESALIPFHRAGRALHVAHSPEQLAELVRATTAAPADEAAERERERFFTEYLGPLDGGATARCIAHLERWVSGSTRSAHAQRLLDSLASQAPAYCRRALRRARAADAMWQMAEWLLPLEFPVWRWLEERRGRHPTYASVRREIGNRRQRARDQAQRCAAVLERA